MDEERQQLLDRMNEIIDQPGGKNAARFILNSLGGVPGIGGLFGAAANAWSEAEQEEFNGLVRDWMENADIDIANALAQIEGLVNEPTRAKLSLLFGEIIGNQNAEAFLSEAGNQIHLVLHNNTLAELEPFIETGWISIHPTHNLVMMGANNRVGNCFEELKRPYGMGSSYLFTVNAPYFW